MKNILFTSIIIILISCSLGARPEAERYGDLVIVRFSNTELVKQQIVFKRSDFVSYVSSEWPDPKKVDSAYNVVLRLKKNSDEKYQRGVNEIFIPASSTEELVEFTKGLLKVLND